MVSTLRKRLLSSFILLWWAIIGKPCKLKLKITCFLLCKQSLLVGALFTFWTLRWLEKLEIQVDEQRILVRDDHYEYEETKWNTRRR